MPYQKPEPIIGLGNDENKLMVQKSVPLLSLWNSSLTLAEFKILDTYLARIDSHKPEQRRVVFKRGEFEKIVGVKQIRPQELKLRLRHLMRNDVEIPDNSVNGGCRIINLFEEAYITEPDNNGLCQVELECSQKAMKYFFNIENLGYLRYKLRSIAYLSSRYSYVMFIYLEHNRFRKSWEISLEQLKSMLKCDDIKTYTAFKNFNKQVLKRIQKEIHEKTECRYTYSPVKKGRTVVAIRFEVATLSDSVVSEKQTTFNELDHNLKHESLDTASLWQEPIEEARLRFSKEQYSEISSLLCMIPLSKLPQGIDDSIDIMRYHYIDLKIKEITRRDAQKPIRNKYNYLITMIKQDMN